MPVDEVPETAAFHHEISLPPQSPSRHPAVGSAQIAINSIEAPAVVSYLSPLGGRMSEALDSISAPAETAIVLWEGLHERKAGSAGAPTRPASRHDDWRRLSGGSSAQRGQGCL